MNEEKKYLTLEEAEKIVDDMYQKRWEECGVDDGNIIHMGNLDKLQYHELEKASILLLRTELRLQQENKKLKEQLEASEKARKEASNILKDYIPDEYIRSCDTSDGIGRYELDTESWQYKIYEILDIDKGE